MRARTLLGGLRCQLAQPTGRLADAIASLHRFVVANATSSGSCTYDSVLAAASQEVFGAFVAAMLYDTVGSALLATLEPDQFQSTLQRTWTRRRSPTAGAFLRLLGCARVMRTSIWRRTGLRYPQCELNSAGGQADGFGRAG